MIFKRIRDLRIENHLEQKQLADYLHISQDTYANYENGSYTITSGVLIQLAKLYHTNVDYILGLTDVKHPYPPKKNKPSAK